MRYSSLWLLPLLPCLLAVLPVPEEELRVDPIQPTDVVLEEPDLQELDIMHREIDANTQPVAAMSLFGLSRWFTGIGTHFDHVGFPYGGCGVPDAQIDSPHYVALNVIHTPKDYRDFPEFGIPRPIPSTHQKLVSAWNNGKNCGRWIDVRLGRYCTGRNSGVPGTSFCDGGKWIDDPATGASLRMIVADSCTDDNTFCRDSFYHLDLRRASLRSFSKDGKILPDLEPSGRWNNREVTWRYTKAPNYRGDILIGFGRDSQVLWQNVILTHLENGVSFVEFKVGAKWVQARMNSDMGQSFIIPDKANQPFEMRVKDVDGASIQNGRIYRFSFPSACGPKCKAAYTRVSYQTL